MHRGFIYRHWVINNEGKEKSYVGRTMTSLRHRSGKGGEEYLRTDTSKFARAIKKYGWDNFHHDILLTIECETKEELNFWLNNWEAYYIEEYNSYYDGYNSTVGGEGRVGFKVSEETKLKIGEANKVYCGENSHMYGKKGRFHPRHGRQSWCKGKHLTEEHKQNISESCKNVARYGEENPMHGRRGELHPCYGRKHTEESKQKMKDAHKKRSMKLKRVICLNTGQVFNSIEEAMEWCGLKSGSGIRECCLKNEKRKHAGKHPLTKEQLQWEYYEE